MGEFTNWSDTVVAGRVVVEDGGEVLDVVKVGGVVAGSADELQAGAMRATTDRSARTRNGFMEVWTVGGWLLYVESMR